MLLPYQLKLCLQYNFGFKVGLDEEAEKDETDVTDGIFWNHNEGKEESAPDRTEGEYR